jgi:lipoprotein-releasing system ATP-binding protein
MTEAASRPLPPVSPGASAVQSPLTAVDLRKTYVAGDGSALDVLIGVDLRVEPGEALAVIGASGAGKSTLLHLLGALDRPSAGEVFVGGRAASTLGDDELAQLRNRHLGFVFQFHHLLREFTALENVAMPALIAGAGLDEANARARVLLEAVGVDHRAANKPWQLSGGEQQRVAVARALVNDPLVLLADEPSGNLDHHNAMRLHDLLFKLREERELAMILVTHNLDLAGRADRVLLLEEGRLQLQPRG